MVDEIEKKDNRRSFTFNDKTYLLNTPTAEDIRGSDWEYSKSFTKCLVEGITTAAEMRDILTRRGIIGPEFEQRAKELEEILSEKILALNSATTIEEKGALVEEASKAREEFFQWNQRLNGPMGNTCEQISDNARLEYLTSRIVVNQDNSRVWNSYDNFLMEKTQGLSMRAHYEVMLFLQGLPTDFMDYTPEAMALKEIEEDVRAKAEEAVLAIRAVAEENVAKEAIEETEMTAEVKEPIKKTKKK